MTDLHPDHLVERAARGALDAPERRRLEVHLRTCVACRVELLVRSSAAVDVAPRDDDAQLIEAAAARALAELSMQNASHESASENERGEQKGRLALSSGALTFAAVAAVFVLVLGGVVLRSWVGSDVFALEEGAGTMAPALTPVREREGAARWPELGGHAERTDEVQTPEPEPEPEVEPEPEPRVRPKRVAPKKRSSSTPPPESALDAEELFARAIEATRRGDDARALALFAELRERFPRSREARTSWISSGRLYSSKRSGAAKALRCFEAYLEGGTSGLLAPEALAGKATALERLGRKRKAKAAWRALLEAFPDSALAAKASVRVGKSTGSD